ncbi:hypothetical protein AX774_g2831 [Zancudomyces culisetae]|uniref:Uncharacterized protein n=1 Tax=Zancudomyces culisetae TaxID=1213189 RepID=A0A1R1PRU2_ZANCU|nr:hypothetical protein AX774_g2831 [Zancudomyces culisetae]|eukprot:OMH83649.1 hypothetical protein AX774_g2831 [Zancudomyces culisetae]
MQDKSDCTDKKSETAKRNQKLDYKAMYHDLDKIEADRLSSIMDKVRSASGLAREKKQINKLKVTKHIPVCTSGRRATGQFQNYNNRGSQYPSLLEKVKSETKELMSRFSANPTSAKWGETTQSSNKTYIITERRTKSILNKGLNGGSTSNSIRNKGYVTVEYNPRKRKQDQSDVVTNTKPISSTNVGRFSEYIKASQKSTTEYRHCGDGRMSLSDKVAKISSEKRELNRIVQGLISDQPLSPSDCADKTTTTTTTTSTAPVNSTQHPSHRSGVANNVFPLSSSPDPFLPRQRFHHPTPLHQTRWGSPSPTNSLPRVPHSPPFSSGSPENIYSNSPPYSPHSSNVYPTPQSCELVMSPLYEDDNPSPKAEPSVSTKYVETPHLNHDQLGRKRSGANTSSSKPVYSISSTCKIVKRAVGSSSKMQKR